MNGIALAVVFLGINLSAAPQHEGHGAGQQQQSHEHGVDSRGDQAMGFDHARTTHNFILKRDGGFIQAEAREAADSESRDQIRRHMQEIARKFAAGDFNAPQFIHERVPPGVPEMKRMKSEITYSYEDLERGARVKVSSANPKAVAAIHRFLRFQIADHRTGDPTAVQ
jgi:hypothetical protein